MDVSKYSFQLWAKVSVGAIQPVLIYICALCVCSGAESLGSILWPGSEEGDIVWCLAFLGTLCGEPIFKVKKCSQHGRERGH